MKMKSNFIKLIEIAILPIMILVLGSIATNIAHRLLLKPTIWKTNVNTDNLVENNCYPQNIYINSNKEEFVVTNSECNFELTILNNYEQELMFSMLEIEIEQYSIDCPIIEIHPQIIDDIYYANICNLSEYDAENLKINITDKDKSIDNTTENVTKYIDVLHSNECELIELLNISNLKSQIDETIIFPILKIRDNNNNILEYQLDEIILSDDIVLLNIPKLGEVEWFFYDITNDIKNNNKVITFHKYKSFIPSEEVLDICFSVSSKSPCAIKISINFVLNGKKYTEDMGNVWFYYPTSDEIEYDFPYEDLKKFQ